MYETVNYTRLFGLANKDRKDDCMQRKQSHVNLIAPRANVTPFPVVVTQSDYDAVPVGGLYWFNCQLQKRYWAAPTPTPETPKPIVELSTKRAVDMEDAASVPQAISRRAKNCCIGDPSPKIRRLEAFEGSRTPRGKDYFNQTAPRL
jgi:hypothetical protein